MDVIADHFIDAHPFADGGDVAVGNPAPARARPSPGAREPAGLDIGSV
ncbi:DNA primase domain protein [Mycobacterium avium subsp. avium 2285 (R)]|nr:DNA primase domain protein [Mycobacterium avium subsp. avium 2285 (R)]